jgi:hypothetical protein
VADPPDHGALLSRLKAIARKPSTRRRVLTMADQGASSLSNIVVAILVARSFDSAEPFGAFAVAQLGYALALGGARSVIGEPLLSLYSGATPSERRRLVADLHGAAFFLGVVGSLVLVPVSIVTGGLSGSALLALAFVLPLLLVQDAWRYLFIIDRPAAALAVDMTWLVAVVVVLPLAPADADVGWFVLAWGGAGALSAVVGTALGWGLPSRPHPWRWMVQHRATGSRFFGEYVTVNAMGQFSQAALGAIAGLADLGAVRASQVFYGPLNTVHAGIYLAVVPEGVRMRDRPDKMRRLSRLVSTGQAGVAAVWLLVGFALPDAWGRQLFGATWNEAGDLLVPMGLAVIAGTILSGALVGVRSLADAERSLRARLISAPCLAACQVVGAVWAGALGFVLGMAVGQSISAVVWWSAFRRSLAERERETDDRGNGPGPGTVAAVEGRIVLTSTGEVSQEVVIQ